MARIHLTDKVVAAAEPEDGRSVIHYDMPAPTGKGTFVPGFALQITPKGTKTFLLCYVAKASGRERRMVIGTYPALTLSAARIEAKTLRAQVEIGRDPWQERADSRAQEAERSDRLRTRTLGDLMAAYVEHSKASGRTDWRAVQSAVARHLTTPFPKLAKLPADEVTTDDVKKIFTRIDPLAHYNEARKFRAYLRAAYSAAVTARHDAGMPAFDGFKIRSNPLSEFRVSRPKEAAETAAFAKDARMWALSPDELAAYYRRTFDLEPAQGALLRFHLLTGGQRVRQLRRLTVDGYDARGARVTIRDIKGRRQIAYKHVVPLIPDAVAAIETMRGTDPQGTYICTVTQGRAPACETALAEGVRSIAKAMMDAGEIARRPTPGTIRKTVETRLMELRVPREVRAHLLSHGRGDVQAASYEASDLEDLKRDALMKLYALCVPPTGNVHHIRHKAS